MSQSRAVGRGALAVSFICFAVFAGEILARRFGGDSGLLAALRLPAVAQVLLLFASAIAFVVASLQREQAEGASPPAH